MAKASLPASGVQLTSVRRLVCSQSFPLFSSLVIVQVQSVVVSSPRPAADPGDGFDGLRKVRPFRCVTTHTTTSSYIQLFYLIFFILIFHYMKAAAHTHTHTHGGTHTPLLNVVPGTRHIPTPHNQVPCTYSTCNLPQTWTVLDNLYSIVFRTSGPVSQLRTIHEVVPGSVS